MTFQPITRTFLRYTIAVALMAGLAACSSRRTQPAQTVPGGTTAPRVETPATVKNVVTDLAAGYADWSDLYLPVRINLRSPMSISLPARLYMTRGRSLHLSLRAPLIGTELAQVHADRDSVWFVDKLHKAVCVLPISSLGARTGITLDNVQSLLLGQVFYPGADRPAQSDFDVRAEQTAFVLTPRRLKSSVNWYYTVSDAPRLERMTVEAGEKVEFSASFGDFTDAVAGPVAAEVALSGKVKNRTIQATVTADYGDARWNQARSDGWSRPTGYRNVTPAQGLEMLKQF